MGDADARLFDRVRLARSANVGPVTYRQLIARFGSAGAAIDALPDLAARGGGRAPRLADAGHVAVEIARVAALGARYVAVDEADYPALLAATDAAPPLLIVRGDLAMLDATPVAIVGARNASAIACRFARELAAELARAGATVISGLARGIDTAAHTGALSGRTAGVIASGIDIAFPPPNRELQERLARGHLLVSEQPPGTEPLARHFPSRNRIIAGLALGTVVVEAAPRSGSLITARLAGDYGRDVMAVPGSPLDPRAQGCNGLIRDGATLIQNAADVLELVRPIAGDLFRAPPPAPYVALHGAADGNADTDTRARIRALLAPTPVGVDELVRQSGLPPGTVALVLLELEVGGVAARHAGGRVSLT